MDYLRMLTITRGTRDFGDSYVVREFRLYTTVPEQRPEAFAQDDVTPTLFRSIWPMAIVSSLRRAREAIDQVFPGLVPVMRSPGDDPVIVETWM